MRTKKSTEKLMQQVESFNKKNSIGTSVRYWKFTREGDGLESKTRSEAILLGGHTPVVWVEGEPGCIALSHIEVI